MILPMDETLSNEITFGVVLNDALHENPTSDSPIVTTSHVNYYTAIGITTK